MREIRWYVMRVHRCEGKAEDVLKSNGMEYFIPKCYALRIYHGVKSKRLVPVIPDLIFLHASRIQIMEFKKLHDFVQFVVWKQSTGPEFLIVPDKQMNDFIKVASQSEDSTNYFQPNEINLEKGSGANRLSEIAARCNEPATNLSRPLKKLIDLGFLEKDVPFGIDEKNAKKSLYKIADPFMAFYYRFVVPNRSFIELDRRLPIEQALNAHFSEYVSMQWEKLCRDAVTGNIMDGVVYGKAKRWWGAVLNESKQPEQVEFDVMAESIDKTYLFVGECKWTTQENGKQLTSELLRKANLLPFAKNYTIVPMLFLKNTPKDEIGNVLFPEDVVGLSM